MRALIDCTPLAAGGGVQVAIALLLKLQRHSPMEWQAALPFPLRNALPEALLAERRIAFFPKQTRHDCLTLGRRLSKMERAFRPSVVFTVFGPAYFRSYAPHLVGFALPHLLYDEESLTASSHAERFIDRFRRWTLRRADHIVVESETVKKRLAARLSIDQVKIAVIGNSVNPIFLNYRPADRETGDSHPILVPSAYYPHKNLEIVPEIAAAMRKLDSALHFQFQLTLDPESRPWRRLREKATALDVSDAVTTLGVLTLNDLAHAYREAAAVFLPTLREASTSVYPESFYFRRPLVTSDRDFAREFCGDAALYVPPRDADATARCLTELLRSPSLGGRLAEAGSRQLALKYPHPDAKFAMQLDLMMQVARKEKARHFPRRFNSLGKELIGWNRLFSRVVRG